MEISGLDFFLINMLSYLAGLGSGLLICCKNKDIFLIRSRSQDNLRENDIYNVTPSIVTSPPQQVLQASAPPPQMKITVG